MIRCSICGKAVVPPYNDRYKLKHGKVYCVSHTTDSQAGEPQSGDGCLRPANKEQVDGQ